MREPNSRPTDFWSVVKILPRQMTSVDFRVLAHPVRRAFTQTGGASLAGVHPFQERSTSRKNSIIVSHVLASVWGCSPATGVGLPYTPSPVKLCFASLYRLISQFALALPHSNQIFPRWIVCDQEQLRIDANFQNGKHIRTVGDGKQRSFWA